MGMALFWKAQLIESWMFHPPQFEGVKQTRKTKYEEDSTN